MRIAAGIHLVASGALGFDLTDPLDCNAWLVDSGQGLVLFDAGAGRDVAGLLDAVRADGLDPAAVTHLFLTHAHADHSGGAAALAERLPGLSIRCGAATAALLARGEAATIGLDLAKQAGVYPAEYRWRPPSIALGLAPDAPLTVGALEVTLLGTPGHSADHCSYLLRLYGRTVLVSGDALFWGGRVFLQGVADCSVAAMLETIRTLSALRFTMFLPGHGLFSLRDGMRHVAAARGFADRMIPPPNLA
ncbi:MAG: MBL fold metallo-hydrolase [Acetobacteraceae bacterium]